MKLLFKICVIVFSLFPAINMYGVDIEINGKIQIDVEGDDSENTGVKFYRFKMDD